MLYIKHLPEFHMQQIAVSLLYNYHISSCLFVTNWTYYPTFRLTWYDLFFSYL